MVNLTQQQITEAQLKDMTIEQCLLLRKQVQEALRNFYELNPAMLQASLVRLNERIFEHSYYNGSGYLQEAHEGY